MKKIKVSKEVKQYNRARANMRIAIDRLLNLESKPEVKKYKAELEAAAILPAFIEPSKTPEETRKEQLDTLYRQIFRDLNHNNDYLAILSQLAKNADEITIDQLSGIANQMYNWSWSAEVHIARVFEMFGIIHEDEFTSEQIKTALEDIR